MCKQKSPTYIYPQIVKHSHATIETHSYWEPKPNLINFQERVEIAFYKIWNKYFLQRCSGLLHDKENSWPKYYWKQKAILSKCHEKELQNDLLPQLVTQNCSSHCLEVQAFGAILKLLFGQVKTSQLLHDKIKYFGKGNW